MYLYFDVDATIIILSLNANFFSDIIHTQVQQDFLGYHSLGRPTLGLVINLLQVLEFPHPSRYDRLKGRLSSDHASNGRAGHHPFRSNLRGC